MIRIVFFLFTALIGGTITENSRKIHCPTAVDFINKVQSSWTAHTYGYNEIDTDHFARNRLGAKLSDLESYQLEKFAEVDTNERALADNKNATNNTLPESFSWVDADSEKTHGCPIDEIRDQSNCGSCWAVSVASSFSDRLCLATEGKFTTPLSANYIAACDKDNYGCDGGYMSNVYNFLKHNGIITGGEYESDEGCQPYEVRPCGYFSGHLPCSYSYAFTPKCRKLKCTNEWYPHAVEKHMYKIDDWKWLRTWWNNEDSIKREIYNNGPITAAYLVYPDFMLYKKGVYQHQYGWWPLGGHAVRVVGWGVEKNVKYWHVANSWGRNWGENGYFKIRRGTNECLFESMMMALQANTNGTRDD